MQKQIPSDYKSIPSFPDYYVNKQGQIVKVYPNGKTHVLSSNNNSSVTLFRDNKRYCRSATSLFMEAWFGQRTSKGRSAIPIMALNVMEGSHKWIRFNSLAEASKITGAPVSSISKIINGYGYSSHGWVFKMEV